MNLETELNFALELCDEIDKYTLSSFEDREFSVMTKADLTPVTEIDQETERRIRAAIEKQFPKDVIEGEEFGGQGTPGSRSWVIDPIDGTKNYLRGIPVWGTLIALCVDTQPVMGVISAPSLHRRWWASKNSGSFVNSREIHVSQLDDIKQIDASYGNIIQFKNAGYPNALDHMVEHFGRVRALGDFWSHMLVAEGAMECGIDPVCEAWDIAPIKIIVEEAGGKFTSLHGDDTVYKGSGVSTNGLMHEEILQIITKN